MMKLADQSNLIGLTLAETWRRIRRRIRSTAAGTMAFSGPTPERLLLAPQDLRTTDPMVAEEVYSGQFTVEDQIININGPNPFKSNEIDEQVSRNLNSFRWFRHLSESDSQIARAHAQSLIKLWIKTNPKPQKSIEWEILVASRRLIAWICHSVTILQDCNPQYYRVFLKSIGRHIRYIKANAAEAEDGLPRLTAYMALAYASICVSNQNYSLRHAKRNLDFELERQIFNDGGHISRNPAILVDLLSDLLPLRQAYFNIDEAPSDTLVTSIDRMMIALRFFRHRDGTLARFNSAILSGPELIATILRYDETLGEPARSFTSSGFERLDGGHTTIIMDCGKPVRGALSSTASAGTLGFEMSADNFCLVVNCGTPRNPNSRQLVATRSTAAHSTLTMNDMSSSRFELSGPIGTYLHGQIISSPTNVPVQRTDSTEKTSIIASHNGYVRRFNVIHERSISLTADGTKLYGTDTVREPDGGEPKELSPDDAAIRFHLHPLVECSKVIALGGDAACVELRLPGGLVWRFVSLDAPFAIQESIFFGTLPKGTRTKQIVIHTSVSQKSKIRWAFEKQD